MPPVLQGEEKVNRPLHLQVSSVSPEALKLVEAAGGTVERVYYTRLGLKALLKVSCCTHHQHWPGASRVARPCSSCFSRSLNKLHLHCSQSLSMPSSMWCVIPLACGDVQAGTS